MTGNEVGDRVHNFFAQDSLPQGQHHSQVADGSWPSLNNNFWSGSKKQVGASSSSPRNYNSLQSDFGRGDNGHPLHVNHGLDFTQTTLRPDFAKSQPQSQQHNWNGYMHGSQIFPTRQDEPNFVGVDSESDRHNMNPRGSFMFESQQGGVFENIAKNSLRPNTSDTPVSFDLFGGQQHMNGQQSSVLHGLPQQQSGFANMQQLQQQLMFRKMQELQRQRELQQLDARQQNTVNQVSSFERQASGGYPRSLNNGNPIADTSTYPWGELTAGNTNWLQRASPTMQGTSSELVFSPEQGQEPRSMGFSHQQADQSLYGVSVSNSRENLNNYPRMATDKTSIQQMAAHSNSFPNQYAVFPDQVTMQDRTMPSRQGFQGKSPHDNASGKSSNSGMSMDHPHLLNPMQQNSSAQEFQEPQEFLGSSKIFQGKKAIDDAVTLDPTEEKILFGSDDNIWDAFGTDTIAGEGAPNLIDGNGFLNGVPSLQSGSWSALMQSAVAETSSSEIGLQEESAGLSCQNPELAAGVHQPSRYDAGEKRQTALAENLRTGPTVSFGSVPGSDGVDTNANFRNAMGSQQYGQEVAYEHGEGLQVNLSKRPNPQSSGGSKLFNHGSVQKTHAERNQIYENSSHSLKVRMDGNTHWTSQQSGSNQLLSKTNNWNGTESVALSGDRAQNLRSEQSTQHPHSNNWKRGPHEEIGHADSIWKVNSVPNSSVNLEHVKSSLGNPQMIREGFAVNAAVPNLSTALQVGEDTSQFLSNNHPPNYWKHFDSSLKSKGTEGSGNLQHHQNKGPQVSESSLNSSGKEELKMHETESNSRNEDPSSSYHSNLSHLVNAGLLRENLSKDAGDSSSLLGGRQKSSNQVTRRTAPQKFQYHPMGDLGEDVEQSYETRQGSLLQAMSQQHSSGLKGQDQGYLGKSKLFGQVPKSSSDTGKGHGLNHQGEAKGYDEARSSGTFPGYMHNIFSSADRSSGLSTPNNSQPSQNMLELLHKVDQSKEHVAMKHFNSSEQNQSSEIPDAENSDGSVGHLQRSQSSNSQGFGLHLAPPLQRLSVGNHASPRTLQTLHSASSSGFPYVRNQAQNQSLIVAGGHVAVSHSETSSFDRQTPEVRQADESCSSVLRAQPADGFPNAAGYGQYDNASSFDTNRTTSALERDQPSQPSIGEKFPVSQPGPTSIISHHGASSGMRPNLWSNVPAQQPSQGIQAHKLHANLPHPRQPDVVDSTSIRQNIENQDAEKRGNFSSGLSTNSGNSQGFIHAEDQLKGTPFQNVSPGNIDLVHKMDEPQGNESLMRQTSDLSSLNPASTRRDLEDFGRSLKPNNFHQSYSLLNQVRAMNDTDSDTSSRGSRRLKEPENYLSGQKLVPKTGQPNESNNMVGDVTVRDTTGTSAESKMLSFSGSVDNGEKSMLRQLGSVPSRDMPTFRQNESQSYAHGISSVKAEHTQISPQMAPSWFNQYGTFKNGQTLPIYEMQKGDTMNTVEQSFSHGNSSSSLVADKSKELASPATDTGQLGVIMHKITPASVSIEHISSSLPTNVSDQNSVALRQKKRKSPYPWHEEVSQSSWNLLMLSMAEAEWAKAGNRRIEKVKDDGEVVEDTPVIRSNRRLVLTTQLMQQLFRPPSVTVLSADASLNYEIVSYFVARLALGDACSLISPGRSSSDVPHRSNLNKPFERTVDQHLSEVLENFMGRARKLEIDLLSMEKRASVLDLRVECQDLEKFAVINRFAKFHGRGQPDGTDGYTAANFQKPVPQRYVTAAPLPMNLPDRVLCLSL